MNTLSTALAFLALLSGIAATIAAFVGYRMIDRADELLHDLEGERRKLKVIRDDQVAIHGRIDRLAGRLYATTRRPPPEAPGAAVEATASGADRSYAGVDQLDPELAAELALQLAAPVAPGRK